jgi:hypothetical protein
MTRLSYLLAALLLWPCLSLGYLGEHTALRAQTRLSQSPSVVQMDEATDFHGVVRQVRWKGPHHPDLRSALGDCYQSVAAKLKYRARARGQGVLQVSSDKCSLSLGGHLGHVYGEAHLK